MTERLWAAAVLLTALVQVTIALPSSLHPAPRRKNWHNATSFNSLMVRDDVDFDASDLSWITKMAAIGDSYSAGIGAGDKLGSISGAFDDTSGKSTGHV